MSGTVWEDVSDLPEGIDDEPTDRLIVAATNAPDGTREHGPTRSNERIGS